MSSKILQKCVAELKAETPRIDYVLGMLEAMLEAPEVMNVATPIEISSNTTAVPFKAAPVESTAPGAVDIKPHPQHGVLTMETPAEREIRLKTRVVPPVFISDVARMSVDPAKFPDKGDITTKK